MAWSEPLWEAIVTTTTGLIQADTDQEKLQKQLRAYFVKGAKGMDWHSKGAVELINEYTDNTFSSLFAGLGDEEWLTSGGADFLLCLDAGIKVSAPKNFMKWIKQEEYDAALMEAHTRAYEEQRTSPILNDATKAVVSGPKITKRVYNAVDQARKEAAEGKGETWGAQSPLEDFACRFIDRTIALLSEGLEGYPEHCLPMESACTLFHKVFDAGGLPLALTTENGAPPAEWPIVDAVVQQAYGAYTVTEEMTAKGIWPAGLKKPGQKAAKASSGGDAWGGKGGDAWGGKGGKDGKDWGPYGMMMGGKDWGPYGGKGCKGAWGW